ncbi:MAG: ribokinase [Chloroflexi bacterium]|nr:ribokinase [Chloroflexota bacterium]
MQNEFELNPEAPILVIGAASIDIVGRLQRILHIGTSNPAHILTSFGGTARNVAENLARLGQPVWLLTAIGKDQVGDQLLNYTTKAGVNTDFVIRTTKRPTGSYLATIDEFGELQFALDDMRAINALTPDILKQNIELFEQAALLFLDANLQDESIEAAIKLAKHANIPVCADPTSTSLAAKLQPYLSDFYLMTPNIHEAGILCERPVSKTDGELALEAAKYLVSQGVDFAIVTLAEFGLSYATSETNGHIPAIRTKIVDPTGGGDALTAAVIFATLNNIPPDEAVRLGVSSAALTLMHRGAVLQDLSLEKLYDHLAN